MAIGNKVVLGDTSSQNPAIASLGGRLFIAWKGSGNDHLNVMFSDTSDSQPSLAVHNAKLLIAWKGSGNDLRNGYDGG